MIKTRFVHEYVGGEDIFHPGEQGSDAYVIESGGVVIWTISDDGTRRHQLAQLGPGEIFGEMALLNQQLRIAGATATETSRLRIVSREELAQRLTAADPLLRQVLNGVMIRLHSMVDDRSIPARPSPARQASADLSARGLEALRMEHAIQEGLERDEFTLHFQPIQRLGDMQTVGYEALARWQLEGSPVSPAVFIPVVERSSLALDFTRWVASAACDALPRLSLATPLSYVSINIPARQFSELDLLQTIAVRLKTLGVAPSAMRLEVTETQLLSDWAQARAWLGEARALGFGVMLDDFGTGYSSLAYLHKLPLTALKIDRSFVAEMLTDTQSRRILKAIALLANDLCIDCIAEGIERPEQTEALVDLGVAFGQGYLFGRPGPL